MTKAEYLLTLKTAEPEEIRDTWVALGSMSCSDSTKVYFQDAIYKIDNSDSTYDGALIYCNYKYQADSAEDTINWEDMTSSDTINGVVSFQDGINAPHFTLLMTKEELATITKEVDTTYVPFSNYSSTIAKYDIPENELLIMLSENGVPFVDINELEYSKTNIINIFIAPMLDIYWKFFPFVEEQDLGNYSSNQAFQIEMPKYAYSAVPYYVIGQNTGASGSTYGAGALNFFRTDMMYSGMGIGGGGRFGGGVRYNKPVPGFVGMQTFDARLQGLQASQGYLNYFRREKFQKKVINGKKYITGFSTIGGALNVKWLEAPPDYSLIEFEDLPDIRDLCKSNILQNFGMLRQLIKADIPGNPDYSLLTNRAKELKDPIITKWNQSSTNNMMAILRGGL